MCLTRVKPLILKSYIYHLKPVVGVSLPMKSGVRKLQETDDASKSITAFFKSTLGVSKVNEIESF